MDMPKKVINHFVMSIFLIVAITCSSICCIYLFSMFDSIIITHIPTYLTNSATEIQNIQIADGDVVRGMNIPIFMVFPRLFTCPTLATRTFKIEFEINLVVLLQDGHLITENFPIRLVRCDDLDSIGSF